LFEFRYFVLAGSAFHILTTMNLWSCRLSYWSHG